VGDKIYLTDFSWPTPNLDRISRWNLETLPSLPFHSIFYSFCVRFVPAGRSHTTQWFVERFYEKETQEWCCNRFFLFLPLLLILLFLYDYIFFYFVSFLFFVVVVGHFIADDRWRHDFVAPPSPIVRNQSIPYRLTSILQVYDITWTGWILSTAAFILAHFFLLLLSCECLIFAFHRSFLYTPIHSTSLCSPLLGQFFLFQQHDVVSLNYYLDSPTSNINPNYSPCSVSRV